MPNKRYQLVFYIQRLEVCRVMKKYGSIVGILLGVLLCPCLHFFLILLSSPSPTPTRNILDMDGLKRDLEACIYLSRSCSWLIISIWFFWVFCLVGFMGFRLEEMKRGEDREG